MRASVGGERRCRLDAPSARDAESAARSRPGSARRRRRRTRPAATPSRRDPGVEGRRGRRSTDAAPSGSPPAHAVVQRREHLAAMRIHPGRRRARRSPAVRSVSLHASASSVETPARPCRPRASASPCIVAMPTRRPVNEPGPGDDREEIDVAERRRRAAASARSSSPAAARRAVARDRRVTSLSTSSSRSTAALPARVVVSSARMNAHVIVHLQFADSSRNPRCPPLLCPSSPPAPRRRCASTSTPSASIATRSCSSAWATSTRCSTRTR